MYNFEIRISYVESAKNLSDKSSRVFKAKSVHTEWSLDSSDFREGNGVLANKYPEVDLFVSPHNKKLEKFCSWTPCVQAMHIDSFSLDWCDINGFLFAPFSCISSVLKKCVDDKIRYMCGIFPPVAHEELVANINEAITRTVQSSKGGREPFIAPLGPVSKNIQWERG